MNENTTILPIIGYIAGIFGLIAVVVAGYIVARSTATKTTIDNQKELITTLLQGKDELKDEVRILQEKDREKGTAISTLQGQVEILRNIPLKDISTDMKSISDTQLEILKILKNNGFYKAGE